MGFDTNVYTPPLDIPGNITSPQVPDYEAALYQAKARQQDLASGNINLQKDALALQQQQAMIQQMQVLNKMVHDPGTTAAPGAPVAVGQRLPGGLINRTGAVIPGDATAPAAASNPGAVASPGLATDPDSGDPSSDAGAVPAAAPTLAGAVAPQPGTNLAGAGSDTWTPGAKPGLLGAAPAPAPAMVPAQSGAAPSWRPPSDQELFAAAPLAAGPYIEARNKMLTSSEALRKSKLENDGLTQTNENNALGAAAQMSLAVGATPESFQNFVSYLHAHGYDNEARQVVAHVGNDPAKIGPVMRGLVGLSKEQAENLKNASEANASQANADTANAERPAKVATAQTAADEAGLKLGTGALAAAANQKQYDAALALAKGKIPPALYNALPTVWSKDTAAQVRRLGLNSQEQTTTDHASDELAETKKRDANTASNEGARLRLERDRFNATLGSGLDANGQPLPPEEFKKIAMQDPVAVATARYQTPAPPSATRGGQSSPLLRKVLTINPAYDATMFPARNKTAIDFAPGGKSGQAITSTDTALAHLDSISQAGRALHNGNYQVINRLANELGVQVGKSPRATYDAIVSMVAPEISKAVIGGVGGEEDRRTMERNFYSSASDDQREGAIGGAAGLLGARYDKMRHAYESEMKAPLDRELSPESQAVRQRYASSAPGAGKANPYTAPAKVNPWKDAIK